MKNTFTILLSFLCIAVSQNTMSQALYPVSMDEKVEQSTLIAEGTVLSQYSFWNPSHTLIFTSNKVKLHKIFKGRMQESEIEVVTQGGTVGTDVLDVSETAILAVGETGVFFCFPHQLGLRDPRSQKMLWDIYSSAQGFLRYDVQEKIADAPFARFQSISNKLYPTLVQKTGRNYEVKDPGFDIGNFGAPGSNNLLGISSFSPTNVVAGATANPTLNLLTIEGTDFGNPAGSAAIIFDDANNGTGGTGFTVLYNDVLVVSWTNTQIKVRVPSRAGTGTFSVRDETGTIVNSPAPLTILYSVLAAGFTGYTAQYNLMNDDGLGGYSILYSTSRAGDGINLDESPTKATFQRALNTWKQIAGFNVTEAGTTTTQQINPADGLNVIMFDNTNTGNAPLAAGVLAVCYSFASTCTPVGSTAVRKTEFDIVIRNTAVSTGSTSFENGPCYPTNPAIDMETVILHELGHAINLGHINDDYQYAGGGYVNINPAKLMHYAVLSGVARKTPDWAAFVGAQYCINPKGLVYGNCTSYNTEMTPLATVLEPKDECPIFPGTATNNNTLVHFDLEHATSNKYTDPQYNRLLCSGQGTSVTNTAFYAVRTSDAGGILSLTVSNYATSPADQSACVSAGVEMAVYEVAACPLGQSYPTPIACRAFNANGPLANITDLVANRAYLIVFDGANASKANFDILINGAALPVRVNNLSGIVREHLNELTWDISISADIVKLVLESSNDAVHYQPIFEKLNRAVTNLERDQFSDVDIAAKKYYRIKVVNTQGAVEYSKVLLLRREAKAAGLSISPNPTSEYLNISLFQEKTATLQLQVTDATGKTVIKKTVTVLPGNQTLQLNNLGTLSAGHYLLRIWDGERNESAKFIIQ